MIETLLAFECEGGYQVKSLPSGKWIGVACEVGDMESASVAIFSEWVLAYGAGSIRLFFVDA